MLLRYLLCCSTLIAYNSCGINNKKSENSQSSTQVSVPSSDTGNADKDFHAFIEQFSKDTAFQRTRTKFPLPMKQYDIDNDKDTIIYEQRSDFKPIDFRKRRSSGLSDQWEQKIVVGKSNTSATIEIRGIENGIMVDYQFEKKDGRWMLVSIHDSST